MAQPQMADPKVTRAELDELHRELQAAREQIAHLSTARDGPNAAKVGPIAAGVTSGLIIAGAGAALNFISDLLSPRAPLPVWLGIAVLGGVFGPPLMRFIMRPSMKVIQKAERAQTFGQRIVWAVPGLIAILAPVLLLTALFGGMLKLAIIIYGPEPNTAVSNVAMVPVSFCFGMGTWIILRTMLGIRTWPAWLHHVLRM